METGESYINRVPHPSRATLCIRRQSDGNWRISELEASCNRKVDAEERKFVEQWLEPYRLGFLVMIFRESKIGGWLPNSSSYSGQSYSGQSLRIDILIDQFFGQRAFSGMARPIDRMNAEKSLEISIRKD